MKKIRFGKQIINKTKQIQVKIKKKRNNKLYLGWVTWNIGWMRSFLDKFGNMLVKKLW
jgi:hypothetical protein